MCDFCDDGKTVHGDSAGGGFETMRSMWNSIIGSAPCHNYEDGIWMRGNELCYESSSGEYSSQSVTIKYCPFCGRELEVSEDA